MIEFADPSAFLFLPLLLLLLRRRWWTRPLVGVLRLLVLLLLCGALGGPRVAGLGSGRDLWLLLDRSHSMPAGSEAAAQELATALAAAMQPGDRLGLLGFGYDQRVERMLQQPFAWPALERPVDADGSDLAAALQTALALLPADRPGSLLVISDGEANGPDPIAVARAAARRAVRIDAWSLPREPGMDLFLQDLRAPSTAAPGQPLVLTATAVAPAAGEAEYRLLANGELRRSGVVALRRGNNLLQFQQVLPAQGLHEFALELRWPQDPVPANNRGRCVVRGVGPPRVLVVTPGGREDRLSRSLRAAGLEVVVSAANNAPLSLAELDGFRAVVLADVPASDLPAGSMGQLADWVRQLGGGLLMTGGKASYGHGGYHRSPIEDVLPVTLELREEQRRHGLAMAIALDRSGSMRADAGGPTKMDLANRGAATAIELLSPLDNVAVLAVDTAPHLVVPMQAVTDKEALIERCRRIESMGGGIYVGVALRAAAAELAKSPQSQRHIVMFADAADAERPEDYRSFVPALVSAGVTVSVIGLGSPADGDGALLQEIARLGNGRCHFVAEPQDLPRVFARETIQVARSAMVEAATAVQVLPGLWTLGLTADRVPAVGGYSLAWPRPRAELDLLAIDEQKAPLLAHWQVGLGRTAALLIEADGPLSGEWADWPGYGDFFATLLRWLCGGQLQAAFVSATRDGGWGQIRIEVEPAQAALLDRSRGLVRDPAGGEQELQFERSGAFEVTARLPLRRDGVYRAAVQLGDAVLSVPPLCLPYSPEHARASDPRAGERLLQRLCWTTGGSLQPTVAEAWSGPRRMPGQRDLSPWFLLAALGLLLLEVLVRRLELRLPPFAWWRRRAAATTPAAAGAAATLPTAATPAAPVPPSGTAAAAKPVSAPRPGPAATGDLFGALQRAKRRGKP